MTDVDAIATAVQHWSAFPVDRLPRPVVLIGHPVLVDGFRDSEAKNAFLDGRIRSEVSLPPGLLSRFGHGADPGSGRPLVVTAARRESAVFETDRGRRELPSWRLIVPGALAPIQVLDVDVPTWWPSTVPMVGDVDHRSLISADGRTLTYRFGGSQENRYRIVATRHVETDAAVAIDVTFEFVGDPRIAVNFGRQRREVSVALRRALGARVLVGSSGQALPVVEDEEVDVWSPGPYLSPPPATDTHGPLPGWSR